MKTKFLTTTILLFSISTLFAQETITLSLKESVKQAIEKNINVSQSKLDKEKSHYQMTEARSSLLPQIQVAGTFQNNTKLPITALPGDPLGAPGTILEMKMGTRYNTSANISANQVLYNQTALTALKLSKKAEYASTLGVEKAKEEITKNVADLYFLIQTTAEQVKLIEDNISRTQRMTDIVKRQVDNGIAKSVDYDRIMVTLQNLQTQLDNNQALHEQQLNMMKYMLEIPLEKTITLTDNADMALLAASPDLNADFSNHIDIQLLESQKEIASLNRKLANHGYIPSLAFVAQYGYQGMREKFDDYFNSSDMNKWYNSSYFGLQLTIPVFDGLQKQAKSNQAKMDYMKASLSLDDTKENFTVTYKNALNNYYNNKMTVERQQNNIKLAEKVYQETSLKYREGLATMSDLLQDEMSLNNAQSGYLNALYNFKDAELEIMSLNGEIKSLME